MSITLFIVVHNPVSLSEPNLFTDKHIWLSSCSHPHSLLIVKMKNGPEADYGLKLRTTSCCSNSSSSKCCRKIITACCCGNWIVQTYFFNQNKSITYLCCRYFCSIKKFGSLHNKLPMILQAKVNISFKNS